MESDKSPVLIVYNKLSENPTQDEKDVILQVEFIRCLLKRIGFSVEELPLTLNLKEVADFISSVNPSCIFNLVESIDGYESMLSCAPFLFEALNIPYTGSSGASIAITSNKCMAKEIMNAVGIPTPKWWRMEEEEESFKCFPIIVKPLATHASLGIEDSSVIKDLSEWKKWFERNIKHKDEFFAEKYIDGREFNLSILEDPERGVTVLPVAEITFSSFPPEKPRIVGYAAKWEEDSFEYHHTPRRFIKDTEEKELIEKLKREALRCWSIFSLKGYARVDFRVDENKNVFVLEVNANPCLSPDAGFIAACIEDGLTHEEVIKKIVYSALKQKRRERYYF
ncbi:MAG: ATP-grasp domain-containing protein [Chitinispirillaceae bacterium]|nr:ATP-grasp domain-containing protein [Chitinispirillaceae bacterium]